MPFKSKAQRRKFAELLVKGEISPETFEEWNRETGRAKLPEYVKSKTGRASGSKRKSKAKRKSSAKVKSRPKAKSRSRSKGPPKRRRK
jgi:hypothetical protein